MADGVQRRVRVGIGRLTDSVVIAAARERGEFAREGIDVAVSRHESWAAIRDQLAYGEIDGAHMLSPMVVASAAGLGPFPGRFTTSFCNNLNGNAITVSNELYCEMREIGGSEGWSRPVSARLVSEVCARRMDRGQRPLTFAVVYPFSMHNYQLRYWLAAGGVHPDRALEIIVVPPSRMVEVMSRGEVDGFCVGDPWNAEAVREGIGHTLITSAEVWSNGPEKVFGVRRDWAEANRETHEALIRAMLRAARWVDHPGNRAEAAEIAGLPDYLDMPAERILSSLTGAGRQSGAGERVDMPDFNVFHRYAANFPWRSHAMWIAAQMVRWGQAPMGLNLRAVALEAFDPSPFREAARAEGVASPEIDFKVEGARDAAWVLDDATSPIAMGRDMLIDGVALDPDETADYLDSQSIHAMRAERLRVAV